MSIPAAVVELAARFERNLEAYRSGQYNETQLRREFLDPFFKALGWDIDNEQGLAEAYKDVVHEDQLRVGDATKAPDYCFRVGGTRKFFLEAKKPSVAVKNEPAPAFQLRRYAYTAKLPLNILSDFEEFAVYDGRCKPHKDDPAATARIFYCTFRDYVEKWDWIASIFSRDAVLKGAFDKYAESTKAKRGTAEFDVDFLATIEGWRLDLARNLALRNPKLTQRELNFAVQRIIDRIIFLRICEARGIEDHGRLQALVNGARIYPRLAELFQAANVRYNSGLFHFQPEPGRREPPDELTLGLEIDDKLLRDLLRGLYYPDSPYAFEVISADILGQVYEQFLGKVIRLTEGHRAAVEEKPEVRKAGGVYYTPTYVVDYIVRQTVGKLVEGKTPKQVSALRVLDPACGSGSFLIGAYQFLLDWHRDWYTAHDPAKWARGSRPAMVQTSKGWVLTIAERKRILLNSIFGVDIDAQAVEVTKLSLLLKVLEGETGQTLQTIFRLFRERALPDLGDNIKCGNSLIGPDFYEQQQLGLLDDDARYRINVFDWPAEFPQVFRRAEAAAELREPAAVPPLDYTLPGVPLHGRYAKATPRARRPAKAAVPAPSAPDWEGGFDVVIGNPPYVLLQDEFREEKQLAYFRSKFAAASYKIDTYHLFIEQAIRITGPGGRCAMITPANYLTNNHLDMLRRLILERCSIERIVVIDGGVFKGISVDNAIFVVSPGHPTHGAFEVMHARIEGTNVCPSSAIRVSSRNALAEEHVLFTGTSGSALARLWERSAGRSWTLGQIADVNFGKQLRDRKKFTQDVISVSGVRAIPATHRPCYSGRDIVRYSLTWGRLACLNDEAARCGGCWDGAKHDARNKLLTRQIGRYPEFAIDTVGWHCLNTMFMVNLRAVRLNPLYVLGVLNSKLIRALWLDRFYDQRRTFPKIKGTYLKRLPIRVLDLSKPADESRHERMVQSVGQMLEMNQRLPTVRTPQEKTALERQIAAADAQIDRLVYDLYGLTGEEIQIVEGAG